MFYDLEVRIQLIHWNADEARQRAAGLKAAGYEVRHDAQIGPELRRRLRAEPPAAFVIDLTRLPSHGRDVALALRHTKATRHVPLVFAGGEAEKVARIRTSLPDAVFTEWSRIRSSLKQAIAHPPANPRVPASVLAGYSGTPLPKKLGIKPNAVVALVDAPPDFHKTLGELPEGARLENTARGRSDLTIWFTRTRKDLERRMGQMSARAADAPLWIVWPKKTSTLAGDLGEPIVRQAGLAAGLVDYKVCAVDATWSGLLFRRRRA